MSGSEAFVPDTKNVTGKLLLWLPFLVPPLLLLPVAALRFVSALSVNESFPTSTYIAMNIAQPAQAYRDAAEKLMSVDPSDGEDHIIQARAMALAGESAGDVIPVLQDALTHSPSDIDGWTSLAEETAKIDKAQAAEILSLALLLGPDDYWSAPRRAALAVDLWPYLDAEGKQNALSQIRLLWEDVSLRRHLESFLAQPSGGELMKRAFAQNPDEIRAMNRWIAAMHRAPNNRFDTSMPW
jgi:hypothetical protein